MATKTANAETIVETVTSATAAGVEKAKEAFGDMNVKAKEAMEKGTKMMSDMTEIAKGNLEAIVESGKIAAKGSETLAKDAAEYGKSALESATAAFKQLAAVKTPAELFQLQTNFAKSALESMIKETTKGSEALLKYAGEVTAPLSSRYSVNVEKFKSSMPF